MRLFRKYTYLNPFFVTVNRRDRKIASISVFEDGEIIARHNRGWFGNNNNLREVVLDCDCLYKKKLDLDCESAFILKSDNPYESEYDLFIHNSVLKLADSTFRKNDSFLYKETASTVIKEFVFSEVYNIARIIPKFNELIDFSADMNKISEEISRLHISSNDFIESLDRCINNLVDIKRKYSLYTEMKNMSVEDILRESGMLVEE